jgi:hypothetical protein
MASPIVEVQDGVGSFVSTTGGVDVTPGNTISIRLQSTSGVSQWQLEVFGVDEITATAPSLTSVNPTTHVVATPFTTVTFPMPSGVGIGRALVFRSSINGGGTSALVTTFGLFTLTTLGVRVAAVNQTLEGDPTFGWAAIVNPALRGPGGGLPPFTNQQYAVLMEDPGGILQFQRLTEDMILPGFAITAFTYAGSLTHRRGDTLTTITANASYTSGPPTSASIANTYGGSTDAGDVDPGIWTINSPFSSGSLVGSIKRNGADLGADPTWTATRTAVKGGSVQATFVVRWTRDVYFGVGAAGLNTESQIEALAGSALTSSRQRTITVSPSNQKVYYAIPQAYGAATFTLNGFSASFNASFPLSLTNVNGVTSTYDVYESTNLLTGTNLNFVVS